MLNKKGVLFLWYGKSQICENHPYNGNLLRTVDIFGYWIILKLLKQLQLLIFIQDRFNFASLMNCELRASQRHKLTISLKRYIILDLLAWHSCQASTLTQWSRACRKSNSSSVQSSAVEDREPTLDSQCSRRSRVWTQCSVSSHFCRIVSMGSWNTQSSTQGTNMLRPRADGL